MTTCRLCNSSSNFINAHAIPEAFFRELRDGKKAPLLVAGAIGHFPKKAPIGVYDQQILCADCEATFSPADTYGIDVLLTRFDKFFRPIRNTDITVAFQADNADTTKLLLFLISILWRASVSSHAFYNLVDLGPYEPIARNTLRTSTSSIPEAFDAVLSRWEDSEDNSLPTTAMLNPHREHWEGVNAYRLYLGKVVAYVKVDNRPFAEPFSSLSLRSGSPCRIVTRELSTSKDLIAMKRTVAVAEQNRQHFRSKRI